MKLFVLIFCMLTSSSISLAMSSDSITENPVYNQWKGRYQGLPPFDEIKVKHFLPALKATIADARAAYQKIAVMRVPATFQNTIEPMESIRLDMDRVELLFSIWASNIGSPDVQKVEKMWAPLVAAFQDEVVQNSSLFARIQAVYKGPLYKKLNPEQQRLAWVYFNTFKKRGAALTADQKKQVAGINTRLAGLYTQFSQNMLNDENRDHLLISEESQLKGLPKWLIASAKKEAEKRNLKGWVIGNTRSSMGPFLSYCPDRSLREKAFKIWAARGDQKGDSDNNPVISEILKLRLQRAKILGYQTFAHWQLSDRMAKLPQTAMDLMLRVWAPAKKQVTRDVADMQKIIDKEKGGFKIAAWDYRFYAEKLRKQRYDIDMDQVKPYLQLPKVQKAMFWVAKQLYGFEFTQLQGVPVYHPDVTVFEVAKKGQTIGLWYFDPYARTGKRSGAWMNAYRIQNKLGGQDVLPIVSNNSNFIKPNKGGVALLSWDDAQTMFHEFGHALHGLSSKATYPRLAGTNTSRDFVEFPSQIHEDWLGTPEVLKFLTNEKGEALPKELVKKLQTAATFNEGFATVEYLASALVDMKIHLTDLENINPREFEQKTLKQLGMPKEIIMRHRMPHFSHLFSSDAYAAGYYSYLWSDVLSQDALMAFHEAKGLYDQKIAKKFQDTILSVGNTIDPAQAYRNFRGRDPKVSALLKSKGFTR